MNAAVPEKRAASESLDALLGEDQALGSVTQRPASTSLGALFVLCRALSGFAWVFAFWLLWPELAQEASVEADERALVFWLIAGVAAFWAVALLGLAWSIWRGSNGARVLGMIGLTISISSAAVGYFASGQEITIRTTLVTLALDILGLLALSSRAAREWARARRGDSRPAPRQ